MKQNFLKVLFIIISIQRKIFLKAIFQRIGNENAVIFAKIRDNDSLNGLEKLREIFKTAVFNSNQSVLLTVSPQLLNNPRFLAMQIEQMYEIVVPEFVEPVLEQGIKDKSLEIENSHEIAEVIMVLSNVWLNPLVEMTDKEGMEKTLQYIQCPFKWNRHRHIIRRRNNFCIYTVL